jgi:GNAT superfamily N-acetyltransferase
VYAIRRARARELPRLPGIERRASELFRGVGLEKIAEHEPHEVKEFEEACTEGRLFVADHDGEPVGFALVELVDLVPHLHELAVDPDHGRRGLGRRLVEFVCEWARRRGHRVLTLTTYRDVPFNGPFYRELGFEPVPASDVGPGLAGLRRRERDAGLDAAPREILRRRLVAG